MKNTKKDKAYIQALNLLQSGDTGSALVLAEQNGFATYEFGQLATSMLTQVHKDSQNTLIIHILDMIDSVVESKYYLTTNGNILKLTPSGVNTFHNVKGDFLRYVTKDEVDYLSEVLQPVKFPVLPNFETPMNWVYLWRTKFFDYTKYKPETCNNGGDYAFYITTHYYARKTRNGWQFCALDVHSTSAEFTYSDDGKFSTTLQTHILVGVEGGPREYTTSSFGEDCYISLDALAEKCDLPFSAGDEEVGLDQDTGEEYVTPFPPNFSELRHRAKRLSEIGYIRPLVKKRKSRR